MTFLYEYACFLVNPKITAENLEGMRSKCLKLGSTLGQVQVVENDPHLYLKDNRRLNHA